MNYLFLEYPKCSTCKRAKNFLLENNINFTSRHIVEDNPKEEEIASFLTLSKDDIKKFFNTSGILYRQLNLKEKLKEMSTLEKIEILSTNGMLIKRPLLVGADFILIGFKEKEWTEKLK